MTVTTSASERALSTPVDWPLPKVPVMVSPLDSKAPLPGRMVSAVVLFRAEPEKTVSGTRSAQFRTPSIDGRWSASRPENPPFILAAKISRVDEEIGIVGRGFIAGHGTGHEIQDAAIAIDPTSLAQHSAIRLVGGDRATLQGSPYYRGHRFPHPGPSRRSPGWRRPCSWSATERCFH